MKPGIKDLKQIVGFLLVTIVASSVFAQDKLHCPMIRNSQRPALLFFQGPADKRELCVAYFDGKTAHNEKILFAKHLLVTQLDNAIFLVAAQRSSAKGSVYVMDLGKGIVKMIAKSTRISCLRAEPQRKTAMLMDSNMGEGVIHLLELDLIDLTVTRRQTLKTESLPGLTGTLDKSLRLSSNFKHIVYAFRAGHKVPELSSVFTLRSLDLSTMKVEDLVSNVGVEISQFSSIGLGVPPFEWINDDEIVFNDMPSDERDDITNALSIFKRVNIRTKGISECLRKRLPLTLDGVFLRKNPLTEQLIYDKEYILDLEKKRLIPKITPFAVVPGFHAKPTKILHGQIVLFSGVSSCVSNCISPSGNNFAYSLRPKPRSLDEELYAKIQGLPEPIKVADGPSWTRAIGWIE
ncbi:MAG: hypothetical protein OEW48_15500 [Phycisphaerae bacterium]|nr:hypothetical protein [Phycisphaerae bacterium]